MELAQAPVSFKKLAGETHVPDAELKAILEFYIERRLIHRWLDVWGQQCFWGPSPETMVREAILTVGAECAMPAKALSAQAKKRLPPYPAKLIAAVVPELLRDRLLCKCGSFGTGSELVGRAGYPGAYLAAAQATISEILAKVRAAGATGEEISTVLPGEMASLQSTIMDVLARLEPSGVAPVSIRELRTAVPNLSKPAMDQAVLDLRRQRRIFLSQHDFPQGLPPHERAVLVDGQDGTFYVAITPRPR